MSVVPFIAFMADHASDQQMLAPGETIPAMVAEKAFSVLTEIRIGASGCYFDTFSLRKTASISLENATHGVLP
jgi:hypothetical protein